MRTVKSHWYLWTVPTDVINKSVLIAGVGVLAELEADGTLLMSNEHCWHGVQRSVGWDSRMARGHGQVRAMFDCLCPLCIRSFFLAA